MRIARTFFFLSFVFTAINSCSQNKLTPGNKQEIPKAPLVYIDGYTDNFSYAPGEISEVFLNANDNRNTTIRLLNINGKPVDTVKTNVFVQTMAGPTPWRDGLGYKPTFSYKIPELNTGIYYWENTQVHFLVKSKNKKSDIVVVYPYNTELAYCISGGKNLYDKHSSDNKRAPAVSFLRGLKMNFNQAYNSWGFLKWMKEKEKQYDYRLISDLEMETYAEIKNSKILIVIGHSEYWTRNARLNFDKFVNAGKDAIILSGNTMWWQVRYDLPGKKMICFKDSISDTIKNPLLKTINWNKPSLKLSIIKSIGCDWTNGGFGKKTDKGWNGYKICAPGSPLLNGLNLKKGDVVPCPTNEFDATIIKEFDADGYPVIDKKALGFKKVELIAFDLGQHYEKEMVQTFIAFQRTKKTGKVINVSSDEWCHIDNFCGGYQFALRTITGNMIDLLLEKKDIFSPDPK